MDIPILVTSAWTALQPYWPVLAAKTAEEIGKKVPEIVGELWTVIKNKVDTKAAAREVLDDLLKDPEDPMVGNAFQYQLKKLLGEDPEFAGQLSRLVESAGEVTTYSATLVGDGAIAQGPGAIAVGARGVSIAGDMDGSTIITGDDNKIETRDQQ